MTTFGYLSNMQDRGDFLDGQMSRCETIDDA